MSPPAIKSVSDKSALTDVTPTAAKTIAETPFPAAETMQCPYPLYEALRSGPPHRTPTGEFVISRRADIVDVTRRPETFSNHHSFFHDGRLRQGTIERHRDPDAIWGLTVSDDPDHAWKRKLAFEMFKPGRIRLQEPMVKGVADRLIDRFIDRGACEFVSEFATRLPASVILTLYGFDPDEYMDRALGWARYEGFGTRWAAPENQDAAQSAILDLGAFLRAEILKRIGQSGDDELSLYMERYADFRGSPDVDNVVADAINLYIGGIITTAHLLGSMMVLFIDHPDQQEKAREGRPALRRAIEESLRYESPVQMIPRLAVEDGEVGGVSIPAGSQVLLLYGAANRDEAVFECPTKYDVERPNVKEHVGFGNGLHFCIGAPLARMEVTLAFEQLFARTRNLRFASGAERPVNEATPLFRGPAEVHIEFDRVA
jgi:cytochrome P450